MNMNTITKIALSIVVAFSALYPYLFPSEKSGSLETVFGAGIVGAIAIAIVFFTAIAIYCKALQKCLELIHPSNRMANPTSVWYMFLLPYNFIEDFFIILNVSKSIENEAKNNDKLSVLKDYGVVTGIGWCIAQVLSLIPNYGGQIAGGIGLILWIIHWVFIHKTIRLLTR